MHYVIKILRITIDQHVSIEHIVSNSNFVTTMKVYNLPATDIAFSNIGPIGLILIYQFEKCPNQIFRFYSVHGTAYGLTVLCAFKV